MKRLYRGLRGDARINNSIETGMTEGAAGQKKTAPKRPEPQTRVAGAPQQVGAAESQGGSAGAAHDANPKDCAEGCAQPDADETGAIKPHGGPN